MTGKMKQEAVVKLLAIGGSEEFSRSFEGLRTWGYEVTMTGNLVDIPAREPGAFDLVCLEIGLDTDESVTLETVRKAFPGLAVMGVTALEEEELDRLLTAHRTTRRDFSLILQPPLELDKYIFAVEEALARRDCPEHGRATAQPGREVAARRRALETARLSGFLARSDGQGCFLNFQAAKPLKENRI